MRVMADQKLDWMASVDAVRAAMEPVGTIPSDIESLSRAIAHLYDQIGLPLAPEEAKNAAVHRRFQDQSPTVSASRVPWVRPEGLKALEQERLALKGARKKSVDRFTKFSSMLLVLACLSLIASIAWVAPRFQTLFGIIGFLALAGTLPLFFHFNVIDQRLKKHAKGLKALHLTQKKMKTLRKCLRIPSVADCMVRLQQSEVPLLVRDFRNLKASATIEAAKHREIVNQRALKLETGAAHALHEKSGDLP